MIEVKIKENIREKNMFKNYSASYLVVLAYRISAVLLTLLYIAFDAFLMFSGDVDLSAYTLPPLFIWLGLITGQIFSIAFMMLHADAIRCRLETLKTLRNMNYRLSLMGEKV